MAATSNQWTVITTEAWAGGLKPFELPSDLAIAFRTMHRFSRAGVALLRRWHLNEISCWPFTPRPFSAC